MYSLKNLVTKNPIQISFAVICIVNFCVWMDWFDLTDNQVSGLNTAIVAVLSLFIVGNTVNATKLNELSRNRNDEFDNSTDVATWVNEGDTDLSRIGGPDEMTDEDSSSEGAGAGSGA